MKLLYHHRTRATDAQGIHIAEMIAAFRKLGHQVRVVSLIKTHENALRPDLTKVDLIQAGRPNIKLKTPFLAEAVQLGYNLVGIPMLLWAMRDGSIDFLYERHSLFNFSGVLAAKLTGRPIVIEVNSPLSVELSREGAITWFRLAKWVESAVLRMATRVIVVSSPLARIVESMGVDPARIDVVPNGVNPERFQCERFTTYSAPAIRIGRQCRYRVRRLVEEMAWS